MPEGLGDCSDADLEQLRARRRRGGRLLRLSLVRPTTGCSYAVIPYNAVAGPLPVEQPAAERQRRRSDRSRRSATSRSRASRDPYGDAWLDGPVDEIADLCMHELRPGSRRHRRGLRRGDHTAGITTCRSSWSNAELGVRAARPAAIRSSFALTSVADRRRPFRSTGSGDGPGSAGSSRWKWFLGDGETVSGRRAQHTYRAARTATGWSVRTTDSLGQLGVRRPTEIRSSRRSIAASRAGSVPPTNRGWAISR